MKEGREEDMKEGKEETHTTWSCNGPKCGSCVVCLNANEF